VCGRGAPRNEPDSSVDVNVDGRQQRRSQTHGFRLYRLRLQFGGRRRALVEFAARICARTRHYSHAKQRLHLHFTAFLKGSPRFRQMKADFFKSFH